MNAVFSKLFRKPYQSETKQVLQMDFESFASLVRNGLHLSSGKNDIRDYLRKHFDENNVSKVEDFPSDSAWINTSSALSIHRDFKGKVVLLDFFTYCCINCMHVLPDLKSLENKYTIEDGLVVVGVHCAKFNNEKDTKNIASAVKRYGVKHAVINDSNGIVWNAFDVHCWPTLVLIGPNSELLLSLTGEGHFELLDTVIGAALDVMKERTVLSPHSLPQIKVTEDMEPFGMLSFPGKITSYNDDHTCLIGIADTGHNRVLVTDGNGIVKFTVGSIEPGFKDGDFSNAKFRAPQGLIFKGENIIYVADTENHAIREIDMRRKSVKTVAGTGQQGEDRIGGNIWDQQEISSPWDVCFGKNQNILLIAMAGHHQIWALYLSDEEQFLFKKGKKGECKAVVGSGREENRNNCYPHAAAFAQPSGLTYCPERNSVFIADSESSSIRELNLETGKVNSVVGGNRNPSDLFAFGDTDGAAYNVKLQHALGVSWFEKGKQLFVVDSYNHKLKKIDVLKNTCYTIKLDDKLNEPGGVCTFGDKILIADTNNHCIKEYDTNTSSISCLQINTPVWNYSIPVTAEKTLYISENGGKLNVSILLNKAEGVSFADEAPAFWSISFADERLQKVKGSETRQDLKLGCDLTINVPKFSEKPSIEVLIESVMYVCKGDLCSTEQLFFVIHLQGSKNAEDVAFCKFSHMINK